jgi:uncharacterized membrane protein required for colicin V production
MLTVFNILIIGLVLLIAYWWANQGLFSAILHLLCVIAAGAIALSVWEPLVVNLLLRGNAFDDYAWGAALIVVFVVSLLTLRIILDKTIRANVDVPHWANLVFGFPVGAAAGVLTIGLFLIGAGHIQSEREIMGFVGMSRSGRDAALVQRNRLWAPVHEWTGEFYGWLSVTSLASNRPLRQYNPDLHLQAASLMRDSAAGGRGKLSLRPQDARITKFRYSPDANRYAVEMVFDGAARDFGEQLTLSSSQIRLIGDARGTAEAKTVHPDQWTQYDGWHKFDDISHYVTSQPGQISATVVLEFDGRKLAGQAPAFIQVRGTRFRLPRQPEVVSADQFVAGRGAAALATGDTITLDPNAKSIQDVIEQSNSIRPIQVSSNQLPPGIQITEDKFISGGSGEFNRSGGDRPARALLIKGIYEPAGTRIVTVDISRNSPATIFGSIQNRSGTGTGGKLYLVDTNGRPYPPVGYIHARPDNITVIAVDYVNFFPVPGKLPVLPTSGDHSLKLLFSVTEGVTIAGFTYGDVTVGKCQLRVVDPKLGVPQGEAPAVPAAGDIRKPGL